MKDTLDISDIDGSKAKRDPYLDFQTRPSNFLGDIEGSKSKILHKARALSPSYDHFDYSDVTQPVFSTKRETNPLAPEYRVQDQDGQVLTIGKVEGSSPKVQVKERAAKERDFCIRTDDIAGAQASSV